MNRLYMNRIAVITCCLICFLCDGKLYAQTADMPHIYFLRNDVKVIANGVTKVSPWCGGVNNPQFALADLNDDGKQDLVLFENQIGVKTFINTGSSGSPNYVYDGNYEAYFPERIYSFLKLVDYNRDGTPDLIDRGLQGYRIHSGHYTTGADKHLEFRFYKDLRFQIGSGTENAYSEPGDIPIVYDVDNDNDIDFLSFYIGGKTLHFYRNCQVEEGLPPDSIKICFADKCWGRFRQYIDRTQVLNDPCTENSYGTTCKGCGNDGSGNKTTHQGNTLCILDMDGDKDLDILNSNVTYSDIQFLQNGRSDFNLSLDSMIAQDTLWGANGIDVRVDKWPAAYHLDIDQDGDKDLLFSPLEREQENYRCVLFYENIGSDEAPDFKYQTSTYLVDDMIDVGIYARPAFYDYNKDGKPDLFIGTGGYYLVNGSLKTMISYYENISEPGAPAYQLVTADFMNLGTQGLQGASLAFGDVDNDGLDDMVIGQTDGTVNFYKNNAASAAVQNDWKFVSNLKYGAGKTIDAGYGAAPVIYDIDKDGKKDLAIGNDYGELHYYRNTGGQGANFSFVTYNLGGVQISHPNISSTFSAPFIGAIDDTKKEYLLVGCTSGEIFVYDGFQDGYDSAKKYTLLDKDYQYIYAGLRSVPAAADIDGDGKYELLVGVEQGGINLYRQLFTVGINNFPNVKSQVNAYPNPARDVLNLSWQATFAEGPLDISLVTVTGQKILHRTVPASQTGTQLDISGLSPGMYYTVVQSGGSRAVNPVAIVR